MSDPVTPLTPEQTEQAAAKAVRHGYFMRVVHQIDELGAALAGQPVDTTISSDEGIAALKDHGFVGEQARIVAEILGWIQRNHCAKATAGDWAQALEVTKRAEASGVINAAPVASTEAGTESKAEETNHGETLGTESLQ